MYWNTIISRILNLVLLCKRMQAWTNGMLKSVVHRAVVNKEKRRLSIAYFMSPASSTVIECPPQLLTHDKLYVPFTWGDFRNQLLIQKRVSGKTAPNRYRLNY